MVARAHCGRMDQTTSAAAATCYQDEVRVELHSQIRQERSDRGRPGVSKPSDSKGYRRLVREAQGIEAPLQYRKWGGHTERCGEQRAISWAYIPGVGTVQAPVRPSVVIPGLGGHYAEGRPIMSPGTMGQGMDAISATAIGDLETRNCSGVPLSLSPYSHSCIYRYSLVYS